MKRFLVAALLFAIIAVGLASAVDWAVTSGLHKARGGNYAEWNDIRSGAASADIIVQGSSRAWTAFSPAMISDRTGLTCYNLGLDGYTLGMQLARYQMYRAHAPKPRVVVQSIDMYGLNTLDKIYQPEQFLAYLDEASLRQELSQYRYFSWFDRVLPLVRYRGEPATVKLGLLRRVGRSTDTTGKVNGYQGQDQNWDPAPLDDFIATHPNGVTYRVAPGLETALREFLGRCREEGVFVVLVYPPEYIRAQELTTNRTEIMDIYRRAAGEYGFPLLDYSADPMCRDTQYFYNSQHVNLRGAERFSAQFAADLRGLLGTLPAGE